MENENAVQDYMETGQPSQTMESTTDSQGVDGLAPSTEDAPQYPETYDPDAQAAEQVDINALDLATEDTGVVDEDKLADRLEYAPSLQPGKSYRFLFKIDPEKPVVGITMKGKQYASFNYTLTEIRDDGSTGKEIRFLNANNFKSGKMESSRAEELLFALGKLRDYNASSRKPSDILKLLQEATTEQKTCRGVVQWRRYDTESGQTWSTAPQKPYDKDEKVKDASGNWVKTGNKVHVQELPWPKGADGKFINRPPEFEGNYGNETVSRVMPEKEVLEARKAQQQQAA